MTDRLYYDNAYLTEFDATVLTCEPSGTGWCVTLDRSAFYPTSGGQPFDTGTLGPARVTDVEVEAGEVIHTVDAPLAPGSRVHGVIDWPRRFDHMQQHAADHMIAGALHRLYGGVTIGLHISAELSTIDVAMPGGATALSPEQTEAVELWVNERIQKDVPVRCWFPEAEELRSLPLRKPPTVDSHVRIVAIGEDEMVACGGTHPSSAGQLGLVKIVSTQPARGKMRLAFLAGMRAFRDYRGVYAAAHQAAARFSTGVEELTDSIDHMKERLQAAEAELSQLRRAEAARRAEALNSAAESLPGGGRLVACTAPGGAAEARELASLLVRREDIVALVMAEGPEPAPVVFGRGAALRQDMGALLKRAAAMTGGRGGGKPDFAQGAGPRALLQAAAEILRTGAGER